MVAVLLNRRVNWIDKRRICVLIFFLIYLAIGMFVYKDYGISWDEPEHRRIALVNAKYLSSIFVPAFHPVEFGLFPALSEYSAKEYGIVFDLPLYIAEVLLGYNGKMPEAYYLRHLCSFLLFYVSVCFFYLIVKNRFDNPWLGLVGCLFLVLSPRFFAESFYNKDIVFLSFFIISLYFFVRYLNNKTLINALLFALASALVMDQRITGLFIPFLAIVMTVIGELQTGRIVSGLHKRLLPLFVYLVSFSFFTVLFWPYLWTSPVKNFVGAFIKMSKFPFYPPVLYLGTFIKATELPWHYIPLWIIITTPLLYTFLFMIGCAMVITKVIKNGRMVYANGDERQDFLVLLLFVVPLCSIIFLRSVLYDGWRHMYFIYAPFLFLALRGLSRVLSLTQEAHSLRERLASFIIAIVVVLSPIFILYQMVRDHPFQHVYFNFLAGNNGGENFELDYWGLSFRKGLEYIVTNDKRPIIKVTANAIPPLGNNALFIGQQDLKRLRLSNIEQADYFLTNYRWHPQPYEFKSEVYSITVDDMKILSVFKLR